MTTKKLTLEDFIAPALSDEPTKLFIHLDGKETKEYLNVICWLFRVPHALHIYIESVQISLKP